MPYIINRFFLIITLFLITLVYALCFTAIKVGLPFIAPVLFAALRAFLGGIALIIFLGITRQRIMPRPNEYKWIIAIGLIATTVVYYGMFLSSSRTGIGIASVLGNMAPLFAVVLAAAVLHEKLGAYAKIALGMGIFGVLLISFPDIFNGGFSSITGLILALGASLGAAAGNVLVKKMDNAQSVFVVTSWQLIVGSLPLFLYSGLFEQGIPLAWNATLIGLLFFLAVIGTAFTTAAWFWIIQHYDVGKLSLFLFLIPVFGLLIAMIVFKEQVQINEILGIAVILFGTFFLAVDVYKAQGLDTIGGRGISYK